MSANEALKCPHFNTQTPFFNTQTVFINTQATFVITQTPSAGARPLGLCPVLMERGWVEDQPQHFQRAAADAARTAALRNLYQTVPPVLGGERVTPPQFLFCICAHLCLSVARNLTMLTTLRIKNLALVSDLTLELQPGCNVITGETGAGKSIIIGALNLVLGERADRTLIRSGEESCSVEAVFDTKKLRAPLKNFLE